MNKRRLAAMLLIIAGVIIGDFAMLFPPAEQLEARNNTTMTITHKPDVVCGVMSCSGNNPGHVKGTAHGAGGGTIRISPTA